MCTRAHRTQPLNDTMTMRPNIQIVRTCGVPPMPKLRRTHWGETPTKLPSAIVPHFFKTITSPSTIQQFNNKLQNIY